MEKLGMEDEFNWDLLRLHLKSISMVDLPEQYTSATWRFHPVEFIAIFRQCGWLGKDELKAIYSKTSETVRERYRIALNRVTRKYLYASSAIRLSHFLGQGSVESSALNLMQETSMIGNIEGKKLYGVKINPKSKIEEVALGHWYGKLSDEDDAWFRSDKYNSKGDLIASSYNWRSGNLDGDHAQKYRGRGFKQLTGLSNYSRYWVYRGWLSKTSFDDNWWTDQAYKVHDRTRMKKMEPKIDDPEKANSTVFSCIDTGGWYLGSERAETLAQIDKDSQDIAESLHDRKIEEKIITDVTKAINGGTIQNLDRLRETRAAKNILL
jgi:predicted chitinase